ncbi:MAG: hypothetical protein WC517_01820 [Patescibacteria group bacterium]
MKKLFLILPAVALLLAGCGNQPKSNPNILDARNAAINVTEDSANIRTVDSEENINNIITLMNYSGNETDRAILHDAIKKGINDGKTQSELDKGLITDSASVENNAGPGYLLGYTFGCKAATGDEDKCSNDMGAKYQVIMMEEFQKMAPAVPTN